MTHTKPLPADTDHLYVEQDQSAQHRLKPRRLGRWGRIGLALLVLYAVLNVLLAWYSWGSSRGSHARELAHIQVSPSEHPFYWPMLGLHVLGGSIALLTCAFQIWPWPRAHHPRVHRRVGRVYAFAGVYPAVLFGLIVEAYWPFSVATALSQVFVMLLWAFVTTMGIVMRRRGLIEEHRRWMLRSFGLTCSVLVELTIDLPLQVLISTEFHSRLGSNLDVYFQLKDSNENWLGLAIIVVVVEGILERERLQRVMLQRSRSAGSGGLQEPGQAPEKAGIASALADPGYRQR